MGNSRRTGWWLGRVWIGMLVGFALAQGLPGAVLATNTTITTLYATTKAAYDNWAKANYAPPAPQTAFPSGTTIVAFYFAYKGAVPHTTQFQIVIRGADGSTVASTSAFSVNAATSVEMNYVTAGATAGYADGTYTADLLVDKATGTSAKFSVGEQSGTGGAPGTPTGSGTVTTGAASTQKPSIPTIYTSSAATANVWSSFKYQPPPVVNNFFSGTSAVGVYFVYLAMVPGTTSVNVVVANQAGILVAQIQPFAEPQFAGSSFVDVVTPNKAPFANGTYTAKVLINGKVASTYKFKVGMKPSSAYVLFYPTSQDATKTWASTKYMPMPQATSFLTGTTTVDLFFEYQGVIANADYYQPVITDQAGKTFFTGASTFFTDDGGEQWVAESPKGGFPNGTYHATLYVDAIPAATTTFTVG